MISLVAGGTRSGKSKFAESLISGQACYIATLKALDDESRERIERHMERRGASWRTYEAGTDISCALGEEKQYLLDSLTVYLTNLMFGMIGECEKISAKKSAEILASAEENLEKFFTAAQDIGADIVLVTDEIGLSPVPENGLTRVFRDMLGELNEWAAKRADAVYFVLMGMEVRMK